jgi:hypothetical protein
MQLKELVEKYVSLGGGYGRPVALAAFGFERDETERVFDSFDEDYNISRYFHFSRAEGATYLINGFEHTHVSIDPDIASVL